MFRHWSELLLHSLDKTTFFLYKCCSFNPLCVRDAGAVLEHSDAVRIRSISEMLHSLREQGRRIGAYGAAAKATTMLACVGIDKKLVDYVVHLNKFKHGRCRGWESPPNFPSVEACG
jgi:hypothetical protein